MTPIGRKTKPEYLVIRELAQKLNGKTEVVTTIGRIDILTDTEVIEVERFGSWSMGLAQLMNYGFEYPNHRKRLHILLPAKRKVNIEHIVNAARKRDVEVSYEIEPRYSDSEFQEVERSSNRREDIAKALSVSNGVAEFVEALKKSGFNVEVKSQNGSSVISIADIIESPIEG